MVIVWTFDLSISLCCHESISSPLCSREERRWIEKQNKAVRQKKKKEEMGRLRALVGASLNSL